MSSHFQISLLLMFLVSTSAGCLPSERTVIATVPADVIAVFVSSADGVRDDAVLTDGPDGQRQAAVDVQGTAALAVFVETETGLFPVHFSSFVDGPADRTSIPFFAGTVDLGALRRCVCGPAGGAFEPAQNPLASIDSDGDGRTDFEDADDDDDGIPDEVDDDDDGNNVIDSEEDLDRDDDCIPDLCDQDGDGRLDALQLEETSDPANASESEQMQRDGSECEFSAEGCPEA